MTAEHIADNIECALQIHFTEDQKRTIVSNIQKGIDQLNAEIADLREQLQSLFI